MVIGVGLYLGEGTKEIESVRITNSDQEWSRLRWNGLFEVIGLSISKSDFVFTLLSWYDIDEI